jgi:hypothetical protein
MKGKGKYLLLLMLLVLLGSVSTLAAKPEESYQESGVIKDAVTDDWAQVRLNGGYVLNNNVWNRRAASRDSYQKVFSEEIDGKPAIGWQWKWSANSVVAYPEVVYGDKPWDEPLGLVTSGLPFKAGSKQVTANFDINLRATGTYNMAFSMWAISNPAEPKKSITHEIMIWNVKKGMSVSADRMKSLVVNGVTFDAYTSANWGDASGVHSNKWRFTAFVARTPILKGPLDISAFLDYMLEHKILTTEHYITSIELGNEVMRGSGITEIKDYSIDIR